MKTTIYLLFAAMVAMAGSMQAQQYLQNLQLNNGLINQHNVSEIDSMTFESGNAVLHLTDGGNESFSISTIDSGYFQVNNRLHSCGADFVHNQDVVYGSMSDQDGHTYKTVVIGDQVWMAENLNTALYRNGDSIWTALAYFYNNDPAFECPYGRLYSFEVVVDDRNLCPVGWHVPSYMEWTTMLGEVYPGYTAGDPTLPAAINLKSAGSVDAGNGWWPAPNPGTNNSGFSALPGGYFFGGFQFTNLGYNASFWSSSYDPNYATAFRFGSGGSDNVVPIGDYWNYGSSVRCLSDTLTNGLLPGCMDTGACNYNSEATIDNGSCIFEGQTCSDNIGGTSNDAYNTDCTCVGEALQGAPNTCGTPSIHNPDLTYGTMTDQEGNEYKTIVIGNQKWMAENLNTSIFRNGDPMNENVYINPDNWTEEFNAWLLNAGPFWDYYLQDASYECPFGKLYNWYAITDPRHVCPSGWHEPTTNEWFELIIYADPNLMSTGLALRSAGSVAAGNGLWPEYGDFLAGNNSTGFSAIPSQGAYANLYDTYPQMAEFWSTTLDELQQPNAIQIYEYDPNVALYQYPDASWPNAPLITQSVRCINDTLTSGDVQVPGCMDLNACNYMANATIDDGNCRVVGTSCNDHLGGTINDVWMADCTCHGEAPAADPASCGAPDIHKPNLTYGNMTDQEGTTYKTIVIGTQEWMAENLATSTYRNGDAIPTSFTDSQVGECADYMDDPANVCPYGKLYNWYAVTDGRHLCPSGWHEPSDTEFATLFTQLDPAIVSEFDPNVAGGAMKSEGSSVTGSLWAEPNIGATNSSGFSAVPSGGWFYDYMFMGVSAVYWTTTELDAASGKIYFIDNTSSTAYPDYFPDPKIFGASVRCVRD